MATPLTSDPVTDPDKYRMSHFGPGTGISQTLVAAYSRGGRKVVPDLDRTEDGLYVPTA